MRKGDEIEAEVIRLDFPNKGVAEAVDPATGEKVRLKVKGVLPGQRVRIVVTKNGNNRREARLREVLTPSPIETETPCPHFARCGGCSYQTLSAEAELALKEAQVHRLLDPVLSLQKTEPVWDPALDSPVRFGYRNKMEFTWGDAEKDGPLALGLHRRGSMYDIESVTHCRIVDEDYRQILAAALKVCAPYHDRREITLYRRMTGEGYLRHLLVRKASHTGEILVDLVTTSQTDAGRDLFSEALTAFQEALLTLPLRGHIAGILHTVNDSRADAVIDEGTEILFGQDHFYEELLGLRFRITPFSFFQTNSHSAAVLYQQAREYARPALTDPDDGHLPVVYDLYSGTGTIAQLISESASRVAGIEIVPEAVEAADQNARENGIGNCFFFAGDVLKLVDDPSVTEAVGRPDLLILDPPREGIHPKALPKLLSFEVENILYISCKPTSLARDLVSFLAAGYEARRIRVINQFPMSGHVESCVLLERVSNRKADSYVKLNVKMADYYRIKDSAETENAEE